MTENGLILIKYWLEVSKEEQKRRFEARINDPLRQWKLSPMDIESWNRWDDYTKARDEMLEATDTPHAPWYIIRSDDKKARPPELHVAFAERGAFRGCSAGQGEASEALQARQSTTPKPACAAGNSFRSGIEAGRCSRIELTYVTATRLERGHEAHEN